jgi:hypothetical protein
VRAKVVTAVIDGVLLHTLLGDERPTADEFEAVLADVLPEPPPGTSGPPDPSGPSEAG